MLFNLQKFYTRHLTKKYHNNQGCIWCYIEIRGIRILVFLQVRAEIINQKKWELFNNRPTFIYSTRQVHLKIQEIRSFKMDRKWLHGVKIYFKLWIQFINISFEILPSICPFNLYACALLLYPDALLGAISMALLNASIAPCTSPLSANLTPFNSIFFASSFSTVFASSSIKTN